MLPRHASVEAKTIAKSAKVIFQWGHLGLKSIELGAKLGSTGLPDSKEIDAIFSVFDQAVVKTIDNGHHSACHRNLRCVLVVSARLPKDKFVDLEKLEHANHPFDIDRQFAVFGFRGHATPV